MSGISMHHARRILAIGAGLGVDAACLARDLGIDGAELAEPDARLPHDKLLALWREAERRSGEECFGLRLVEIARSYPPDFVLAYAVITSATLGEAYRRVTRYVRLSHDGAEFSVLVEGGRARLRLRLHAPLDSRHSAEYGVGMLYEVGRRGLGDRFRIEEVRFRHGPPARLDVHERIFCAPSRFDQPDTELVFDAGLLAQAQAGADPALTAILERHMEGLIAELPPTAAFTERARQAIVTALRDGTPTAERIAEGLRCSPRTLHRRLVGEGRTFQALLDQIRHDAAARHLKEGRIEIGAIAFLLGFSEVSAFHRAFKRWAGCTPAEYRRARLRGGPGGGQPSQSG